MCWECKRSIIAGTSKAPPPIPNNPDINPTIKAIKIARNGGNWWCTVFPSLSVKERLITDVFERKEVLICLEA